MERGSDGDIGRVEAAREKNAGEVESLQAVQRPRLPAAAVQSRMVRIEQQVVGNAVWQYRARRIVDTGIIASRRLTGRHWRRREGIVDAQAQGANHLDRPSAESAFVFVAMKLKHVEAEFSPAFLDIVAAGVDENANRDRATGDRAAQR